MFFSKLRTLKTNKDIIKHFVESIYSLTRVNVIYLDYHKTHSLLSLAHHKGNLEFEYKMGIDLTEDQVSKILLDNKIPNLDKIKGLTNYETFPIQYNNILYGVLILDGIKDIQTAELCSKYIPHFASFLHTFKQAMMNKKKIDPTTGFHTKKYFYKTLYELFDKDNKLGLIVICPTNLRAMEQINHKIYKLRENEFAILVRENLTDTASTAEKIRRNLLMKGTRASMGVSSYPETCHDADSLLYTAQSAGLAIKNKYRVCTAKELQL